VLAFVSAPDVMDGQAVAKPAGHSKERPCSVVLPACGCVLAESIRDLFPEEFGLDLCT
jgi:hypothetical protein